jgi:hypothetical protein
MPLRNRVTPFGNIIATPERGTMLGEPGQSAWAVLLTGFLGDGAALRARPEHRTAGAGLLR